jgi:hypothetical protein
MSKQEHWDAKHPIRTQNAEHMSNLTNRVLGNKFVGINEDVGRVFSLYNFILKHRQDPAAELRQKITENGKPIFSKEDIESIQQTVRSQVNTPYVQRLLAQSGGANTVKNGPQVEGPKVEGPKVDAHPLDADPSRSKFWDRAIRKIMAPISKRIPPSWDGALWYAFILYSLEQNTLIGPFLSTALDTITLSLPVVSDIVSDVAAELAGLVPMPYAAKAGDILGYAFSLIFVVFAVFLNMSRRHFGSAFKVSLEAVPVLGDVLTEGAQMFEVGAERYLQNRKRILKSVETVSPTAEHIANYYSPSDEIYAEGMKAPSLDPNVVIPAIKKEVIQYGLETSGLGNIIDQIPTTLPTVEQLNALAKSPPNAVANTKLNAVEKTQLNAVANTQLNAVANTKVNAVANTKLNTVAKTQPNALTKTQPKKGGYRRTQCLRSTRRRKTRKRRSRK